MVLGYFMGLLFSSARVSFVYPKNNDGYDYVFWIFPHFIGSVALSGSLPPQMYIHLVHARDSRTLTPSQDLSAMQFASFPDLEVCASKNVCEHGDPNVLGLLTE